MENKDTALEVKESIPVVPSQLIDPELQIEFATKSANALKRIIDSKKNKVIINNEQYIEFEDWQTIGRFYGLSVGTEWTKPIERDGKLIGYEAKAAVVNNQGTKVGAAEAACFNNEKNWTSKPEFQLRSMAQTRAMAKALRSILGYVVVLAGYDATPAEEMNGSTPFKGNEFSKPVKKGASASARTTTTQHKSNQPTGFECHSCGNFMTQKVNDYSVKKYGKPLCYECQKQQR